MEQYNNQLANDPFQHQAVIAQKDDKISLSSLKENNKDYSQDEFDLKTESSLCLLQKLWSKDESLSRKELSDNQASED